MSAIFVYTFDFELPKCQLLSMNQTNETLLFVRFLIMCYFKCVQLYYLHFYCIVHIVIAICIKLLLTYLLTYLLKRFALCTLQPGKVSFKLNDLRISILKVRVGVAVGRGTCCVCWCLCSLLAEFEDIV